MDKKNVTNTLENMKMDKKNVTNTLENMKDYYWKYDQI